ncbi:MAG: hypothetical protein PHQ74_04305 [Crocinitomicaceae bacterium]|nr:hypothetical protein [Crocinitomicaceae bacterium]
MLKTKKLITIFSINVLLVVLAFLLYYSLTEKIIYRTENGSDIADILLIVLIVIFILSIVFIWKLQKYTVGIVIFGISFIVFLFFGINKLPLRSDLIRMKHTGVVIIVGKNQYFNGFETAYGTIKTEVAVNKCFDFDSVDVKVIKGIFGYTYYMKDIQVVESNNCEEVRTTNTYELGAKLNRKRCFSQAIELYTNLISQDSHDEDAYYNRGLSYLFRENYQYALRDFMIGASNFIAESGNLKSIDVNKLIDEIATDFKKSKIQERYFKDLETLSKYEKARDYVERIKFCISKIEND